jgi:hypothetical protein
MHRAQLVRYNLGNLQTAGVGTNIDGGKSRHVFRMISGAGNLSLRPRYTSRPAGCCFEEFSVLIAHMP